MMYLSRISLGSEAGGFAVARLVGNPYRLHQELWRLFTDQPNRKRDFLYRVERQGEGLGVLSLSSRLPSAIGNWRVESREFRPALASGDRLVFSLRANPVVTREGKRHDVVMDAKRALKEARVEGSRQAQLSQDRGVAWLAARGSRCGFAIRGEDVVVAGYEVRRFEKPGGQRVHLATCDFTGVLTVVDEENLLKALSDGIGPAKAFGCGLMLVKRSPS
jgi:CRISPR system Cascade subunit CasE